MPCACSATQYPKSPRAAATIHDSLNRKNILFASLSPEDIDRVSDWAGGSGVLRFLGLLWL